MFCEAIIFFDFEVFGATNPKNTSMKITAEKFPPLLFDEFHNIFFYVRIPINIWRPREIFYKHAKEKSSKTSVQIFKLHNYLIN